MDQSILGQSVGYLNNGIIEDVFTDRNSTIITVNYSNNNNNNNNNNRRMTETIRLAVGRNTAIIDEFGNFINPSNLNKGAFINALFSNAMTRSIPPQSTAYFIQVLSQPMSDTTTIGRIIAVNFGENNFTTISDNNLSSTIQFNVSDNTRFFDMFGRPINFYDLLPGFRVNVRHASFMTSSIPPQTAAYEVRILR